MSKLKELVDTKQAIKTRRSAVLRTLRTANAELREIDDELLAVDLEIRLEESKHPQE